MPLWPRLVARDRRRTNSSSVCHEEVERVAGRVVGAVKRVDAASANGDVRCRRGVQNICRRMEAFAAHGSLIMKNSSERDPTPHAANKSRWPWTVMVVCVLIGSVALSVFWSNQHTLSNWKRYQAQIAARGDSVDWRDYVPPSAPPDDKNFGATPLLQIFGISSK